MCAFRLFSIRFMLYFPAITALFTQKPAFSPLYQNFYMMQRFLKTQFLKHKGHS